MGFTLVGPLLPPTLSELSNSVFFSRILKGGTQSTVQRPETLLTFLIRCAFMIFPLYFEQDYQFTCQVDSSCDKTKCFRMFYFTFATLFAQLTATLR